MWKPIIVGIICGAAIAIGLGLFDGYQNAKKKNNVQQVNTSVASAAYGVTNIGHHTTDGAINGHHTMKECVDVGYYYYSSYSSGKAGKGYNCK
jgi:hypothetical protein